MREAVIVSGVRTALGSFNGSLGGIGATQLGALVIDAAIRRAGISKEEVDEVMMGQVLPCGYGQNPAKQAAVKAGLPWAAECITINKVCGSDTLGSPGQAGFDRRLFGGVLAVAARQHLPHHDLVDFFFGNAGPLNRRVDDNCTEPSGANASQ